MFSSLIQKLIGTFLSSDRNPKTAKDVVIYVYKESGIRVPIHLVRQYMKSNLKLSYKVGKSRPSSLDLDNTMVIKSYFADIIAQFLPRIDVIVNIDEAWFSRTLINKKSWLRNGFEDSIANIKYSGSLSLISWITSSGWSFNASVSGNINSRLFI